MLHRGLKVADDSIEDIGQIHSGWALGHAQDKKIRPGIPHQGHLGIVTENWKIMVILLNFKSWVSMSKNGFFFYFWEAFLSKI